MKRVIITMLLLGGLTALSTMEASAFVCARGVYRAGCVGGGGGAIVRGPVYGGAAVVRGPVYGRVGVARRGVVVRR
jgi:hypothetical protein